ncbi:MAG: RDD family protein [Armatimonadetes bacterium]|nr:RDD family protein [Armatimonadota bacterium]
MNDRFLVLTPEKVVLDYRICGIGSRIAAHVLDLALAVAVSAVPIYAFAFLEPVLGKAAADMAGALAGSLAFLGYFVVCEGLFRGQTVGKMSARMRVVMADGTPVTFLAAFYRNVLRPADMLPIAYLIGFVCMFTNPRSQRLGDLAAGTIVVAERPRKLGFTPAPHHVGIHRFEDSVGALRKMTIEEYQVLKNLCDRFPELPATTQEWSVRTIWKPFAERHGIEPVENVHPVYQMEATVMKFGRMHNLI